MEFGTRNEIKDKENSKKGIDYSKLTTNEIIATVNSIPPDERTEEDTKALIEAKDARNWSPYSTHGGRLGNTVQDDTFRDEYQPS